MGKAAFGGRQTLANFEAQVGSGRFQQRGKPPSPPARRRQIHPGDLPAGAFLTIIAIASAGRNRRRCG
jgi:hypothetical protein